MITSKSKLILGSMSILILGLGVGYSVATPGASGSTAPAKSVAVSVEVKKLDEKQPVSVAQEVKGKIEAIYQAKLGTALTGMYLESLKVKEGDLVTQGQVLATLKSDIPVNALSTARLSVDKAGAQRQVVMAQLAEAELALTQTQEQYDRTVKLQGVGSLSQEAVRSKEVELLSAKERVKVLKAQVDAANLDIKSAQLSLSDAKVRNSYSTIVSPFEGVVVDVKSAIGETVNGEVVQVQSKATRAVFKVGASVLDGKYQLSIEGKKVVPSIATLDNSTSMYVPMEGHAGQGVSGKLLYTYEGIKVPSSALIQKNGQWTAWFAVQDKSGWKAKSIKVELAPVVGAEAVILSDVPSTQLIVSGVDYLQENQLVTF